MLCEVETDKATIGWESQEEGFVAALLLPDGAQQVPVGAPAAVIVEDQVRRHAWTGVSPGFDWVHSHPHVLIASKLLKLLALPVSTRA